MEKITDYVIFDEEKITPINIGDYKRRILFIWKEEIPYKIFESFEFDICFSENNLFIINQKFNLINFFIIKNEKITKLDYSCVLNLNSNFLLSQNNKHVYVNLNFSKTKSLIYEITENSLVPILKTDEEIDFFHVTEKNDIILLTDILNKYNTAKYFSSGVFQFSIKSKMLIEMISQDVKFFLFSSQTKKYIFSLENKNFKLIKEVPYTSFIKENFLFYTNEENIYIEHIENIFYYMFLDKNSSFSRFFNSKYFDRNLIPLINNFLVN